MKANNDIVTSDFLGYRSQRVEKKGFQKPRWIYFCEALLAKGYVLELYEARKTVSKYVTVKKEGFPSFKVRFSNHKPIPHREIAGDCDFFVGHTNLTITNTEQAFRAVAKHFGTVK